MNLDLNPNPEIEFLQSSVDAMIIEGAESLFPNLG